MSRAPAPPPGCTPAGAAARNEAAAAAWQASALPRPRYTAGRLNGGSHMPRGFDACARRHLKATCDGLVRNEPGAAARHAASQPQAGCRTQHPPAAPRCRRASPFAARGCPLLLRQSAALRMAAPALTCACGVDSQRPSAAGAGRTLLRSCCASVSFPAVRQTCVREECRIRDAHARARVRHLAEARRERSTQTARCKLRVR